MIIQLRSRTVATFKLNMPKTTIIRTKLPTYQKDRQEWRREILNNVRRAKAKRGIQYDSNQLFEVEVLLYMKGGKRHDIHDVDNRLKDILDALQGRFRGSAGKKCRLIENDNKICKATIEKRPTPKSLNNKRKDTGGKILIRPYQRTSAKD
jgi:Holliday junction resolvase RusA-like endonuclease